MTSVTEPAERDPSAAYPGLVQAVERAARKHARLRDPLERAQALTELLAALQEEVRWVAADRDQALIDVFQAGEHPSHRALARDMTLSRQRIDQLARHANAGGRPQRR